VMLWALAPFGFIFAERILREPRVRASESSP
jgi:hypothetical protein